MSLDDMDCSKIQDNLALLETQDGLNFFWSLQSTDCSWCQGSLDDSEIQDNLALLEAWNSLNLFWNLQSTGCSWF